MKKIRFKKGVAYRVRFADHYVGRRDETGDSGVNVGAFVEIRGVFFDRQDWNGITGYIFANWLPVKSDGKNDMKDQGTGNIEYHCIIASSIVFAQEIP